MFNISIVLYKPRWQQELLPLLEELLKIRSLRTIYLVDNSPQKTDVIPISSKKIKYIFVGENIGYGRGHNIAIRETIYQRLSHHLVMNSDIKVDREDVEKLYDFLSSNDQVGVLMPKVTNPNGDVQYLCKLLPSPMDVFGRRFLPSSWIRTRNDRYELRGADYSRPMNVPYLSGCFMFLRTEAVFKARLFDERFFMYPEDVDLTRRIHRDYLTLYYPSVTIIHNHAKESYHNLRLLWIHCVNMCKYFNKWGWFFDRERRLVNKQVYNQLVSKGKQSIN